MPAGVRIKSRPSPSSGRSIVERDDLPVELLAECLVAFDLEADVIDHFRIASDATFPRRG